MSPHPNALRTIPYSQLDFEEAMEHGIPKVIERCCSGGARRKPGTPRPPGTNQTVCYSKTVSWITLRAVKPSEKVTLNSI